MDDRHRQALDAWLCSADAVLAAPTPSDPAAEGEPTLIGKLWARFCKERDLELHVRVGWLFGTEYVQMLDYVPSTGRYESAVLVEAHLLGRLLESLHDLHRYSSPRRSR